MNCQQGDVAVIVRSYCGNEGKIGTCLRLASDAEIKIEGQWHKDFYIYPVWVMDIDMPTNDGSSTNMCPDNRLRPLRDNDGEDEIIRIAGLPVDDRLPA